MDTKSDDTARKLIHDDEYPVALQKNGFAPKQVNAPEAVFRVSQEGQPRRPATTGIWPVMGGKDAPDYIFIDIVPNAVLICWAIRGQPNRGLCRLCSTMAWMSSGVGPSGPGLPLRPA